MPKQKHDSDAKPFYLTTSSAVARQRLLYESNEKVTFDAITGSGPVMVITRSKQSGIELLHDNLSTTPDGLILGIKAAFTNAAGQSKKFERLYNQWQTETLFCSSVTEIVNHTAYQQIIGMGPAVLPLILKKLEENSGYWFWALKAISGEDPVPENKRGFIPEMTTYWINWGRSKGYV